MTTNDPSAQDIAHFLQEHPAFFDEHPTVFANLHVPNPHGGRAISLAERQILTLRERNRSLEWRLNELVRNAGDNETIAQQVTAWSARLLRETDAARLPAEITLGLAEQFNLDHAGLRLWNLPGLPAEGQHGYGAAVSDDARTFADSLKTPYCGNDTGFEAVRWLDSTPKSLALVALRLQADAPSVGLLILGSDDAARFTPEMGTAFLETIGQLASAALHRLA
ncbi:DUF484 family protein [Bordetella holmesii]|uniref:PF04340 family protein n=2 Tax=Bordetella holmesii TaxID=35814 RepID=A0A158M097_9BORD|nr:DUF484 family protein [Bordetella holmesii]AHV91750.1 hypothetical protein D560_1266 [Bordetella holmesii ATCC 51541]AIT25933.1 hypothetical protein D558_1255 [Bordetella holmesii 44057]EWM42869.1 hypothetical protein D556_1262 [Bordetella holmesii 41130]EWM46502.1 hypothetical protein D555_1277 [Bordetella holmesii 35009]EWM50668.1 hypothetical protein D557_0513 [Bordetella holmesii 70147]